MRSEKDIILNDNLWSVCFKLSVPAVIAMVLYGLNMMFDAFFVGRFVGETAFSGVSIVYPLNQFSLGLGSLIGVGAGAFLSILIGQNNIEKQEKLIGNANTLILAFSVLVMILGFTFIEPAVKAVGARGEILNFGVKYFKTTLLGSVFWIGGLSYNMIVRAEGKMKTAAIMMGIGLLINIISNYILMVIFNFGVEGAAWGTNIGMFVYTLLFVIYSKKGMASFPVNLFSLKMDKDIIKSILSLGLPSFLMSIMTVIQGITIMKSLNTYGTETDIAFYGAVFRVFNFSLTPIFGLMRALQPTAGINYGAKKYERVIASYKIYSFVAFILMMPIWLFAFLFPENALNLIIPNASFNSSDIFYMRIFISIGPFLSLVMTGMSFFPAINKPKPAAIIGVGRQAFLYIPLMIILPKYFGIKSIYLGSFLIDVSLTLIVLIIVIKEFKNLRKLKSDESLDNVK